jgi:hypothetical protein
MTNVYTATCLPVRPCEESLTLRQAHLCRREFEVDAHGIDKLTSNPPSCVSHPALQITLHVPESNNMPVRRSSPVWSRTTVTTIRRPELTPRNIQRNCKSQSDSVFHDASAPFLTREGYPRSPLHPTRGFEAPALRRFRQCSADGQSGRRCNACPAEFGHVMPITIK